MEAAARALMDGENDEAIRLLEKLVPALKDGAEKDQGAFMLGIAHFNARHWKEARACMTRVLAKDPGNTTAQEVMKQIEKMEKP